MPSRYPRIPLRAVKTYPIRERKNLVKYQDFVDLVRWRESGNFLDLLPDLLKAGELKAVVEAIVRAYRQGKPVIVAVGAHVIKCGLSPLIIDLMRRGIIRAVAMTGAGAIHDYEMALQGETSEEVEEGIKDGRFGMAREAAESINSALQKLVDEERGIGEALGQNICDRELPFRELSLLAAGYELAIPVTIHLAIGTDVIHMHPSTDGAVLGQGTYNDFQLLASVMIGLDGGGCFLNIGSAVVLPEVFLKALSLVRNLGYRVKDFVTVDLDMLQHYRPMTNVVSRPHHGSGRGYALTGHHEILVPLLYFLILSLL